MYQTELYGPQIAKKSINFHEYRR